MNGVLYIEETLYKSICRFMKRNKLSYFQIDFYVFECDSEYKILNCTSNNTPIEIRIENIRKLNPERSHELMDKYKPTKLSPVDPKLPTNELMSRMP